MKRNLKREAVGGGFTLIELLIVIVILGILVILLLTSYLIRRSRIGLALQSIGEGEDAAAHIGINVSAVKTIVFALSAVFVGAAGAAMAKSTRCLKPPES